ncbi:MAG: hypothetical protein M3P53_07795 [Actinomycetota bacterium]|nr:hypothetical protein [Actinomycetota bacterium]
MELADVSEIRALRTDALGRRVAERDPQGPLARESVGIGVSPPTGELRRPAQRSHPWQQALRRRQE